MKKIFKNLASLLSVAGFIFIAFGSENELYQIQREIENIDLLDNLDDVFGEETKVEEGDWYDDDVEEAIETIKAEEAAETDAYTEESAYDDYDYEEAYDDYEEDYDDYDYEEDYGDYDYEDDYDDYDDYDYDYDYDY